MGDSYFDILLFAAIAAFLVLRLRSVLGKRTGHQTSDVDPFRERRGQGREPGGREQSGREQGEDKVVRLPDQRRGGEEAEEPASAPDPASASAKGIGAVRSADPSFEEGEFLQGARAAFEMIVMSFAEGDAKALRPLLADEVYRDFAGAIEERKERSESLDTTLVGIDRAELSDAEVQGRTAFVTVLFVSQQVNVTRDSEGRIIEGDPNEVETIRDIWTFARNVKSRDPNWKLVATQSPQS